MLLILRFALTHITFNSCRQVSMLAALVCQLWQTLGRRWAGQRRAPSRREAQALLPIPIPTAYGRAYSEVGVGALRWGGVVTHRSCDVHHSGLPTRLHRRSGDGTADTATCALPVKPERGAPDVAATTAAAAAGFGDADAAALRKSGAGRECG